MESVKKYTLEEFVGLYDKYLTLRKAAHDNNYELEFRQSVNEFQKVIVDYAYKLICQDPSNKKVAAVLLNSGIYQITSTVYPVFDESLRDNKYLTLLALKGGLSRENYGYIGDSLQNDKEVMFLAARGDMSGNRVNTFYQFGQSLLDDEEFLTNVFRVWENTADISQIQFMCDRYGINIDGQVLINSYHRSRELNEKESSSMLRYGSPYDSGLINYSPSIYYNSKEIAELSDMFEESETVTQGYEDMISQSSVK